MKNEKKKKKVLEEGTQEGVSFYGHSVETEILFQSPNSVIFTVLVLNALK